MKVYEQKEIKVGKKKVKVWIIAFTPEKGVGDWPMDREHQQCVDYVQKIVGVDKKGDLVRNGGINTNMNKLAENAHTQCPHCKHIFDHTKDDANKFEEIRRSNEKSHNF